MTVPIAEGDLVIVQGKRTVYRVTRIKFNGEMDCVGVDGKLRTFRSDLLRPAPSGSTPPPRSGAPAPARKRGAR